MIVDSECDSDCDDEQEDGDREQEVDRRQHPQDQRVRAGESEYDFVNFYNFTVVKQKSGVNMCNLKRSAKRTHVYKTYLYF